MSRVMFACCLVALLLLSACSVGQKTPVITISGTLSGSILPVTTAGSVMTGPIPGIIECNNHQIQTDANGAFALTVPKTDLFDCVLSASPSYVSEPVHFD